MRERVVIVFIAIAIGLIITTLIFFLYQQTRTLPNTTSGALDNIKPTTAQENGVLLVINEPPDESLSDRRSIEIKGETDPQNIIVVSTNQEDVVAEPTSDGDFSVTITIDAGSNRVITRALAPDGKSAEDIRIITFNTEEF